MRDISKLLLPVCIGLIIAVVLMFSIMPLNGVYHSLLWELEQFKRGWTWEDKQSNGCFASEDGVTYYDEWHRKEITTTMSCSSNALPWEVIVWTIPIIIGCGAFSIWNVIRIRRLRN